MNIKRIGSAITIVIVDTELIVVTKAISTIIFDLVKEEHTLMGVCYRLGVIAMILRKSLNLPLGLLMLKFTNS